MPIAIYRHFKLTVAVSRRMTPVVLSLHRRRFKSLYMEQNKEGVWVTRVDFHHLSRYRDQPITKREAWEFQNGTFSFIQEHYRREHCIHTCSTIVPPASTVVWTENGQIRPIHDQFETEISAMVAAQRYLHHHKPNPYDFMIAQLDLNPNTSPRQPTVTSTLLPPLEMVEINAQVDRSENSEKWAQLFLD
jgi:hypothetical protein